MNAIRNLKLRHHILFLPAIPIIGLLMAAGVVISERTSTATDMKQLGTLTTVAINVSEFVHELQKERGGSALYLGSKGAQFVSELPGQRSLTDQKRAQLDRTIAETNIARAGGRLGEIVSQANALIRDLESKRQQISAQQIAPPASAAYFTGLIARLLDVGAEIGKMSRNPEVSNELAAYVGLMQAKERAGQERALGAAGFAARRFDLAQYGRLSALLAEQDSYFKQFERFATPDHSAFLARTVVGDQVNEAERLRKAALETQPGQDVADADGAYWFRVTTARIDLLKKVEDRLAENLLKLTGKIGAEAQTQLWIAAAACLVLLVLTGVLGTVIIRAITRPILSMTEAMKRLAGGDTMMAIPAIERTDEVGEMARAVQVFKDNMIETERLRAAQAEEAVVKQRRAEVLEEAVQEFETSISDVVGAVSSAATEMQSSAKSMTATAEETSRQSTAVAAASEEASANVQTVAAASEELSSSIAEISRQVAQSAQVATKAVDEAARTDARVQGLADTAQKIGDVVQLINDIAAQTNLLALNATIEAARAGEAGKGFAVVASEVKSLANQTAKATEEIGAQIAAIQGATNGAVEAIKNIGATIAEVNQIATSIASAVEEQGAATQEIARNVQQAAAGTTEVSTNIAGVTQAASETGGAATQVLNAAGELSRQSEMLRNEVDRFLARVRAA